MRVAVGIAALLLLGPVGCPGQGAAPGRSSASDESGRAPGAAQPVAEAPTGPTPAAAPPLPDGLVVAAEPGADGVALVIQNRGERVIELALDARVERVGSASPTSEALRLDCAEAAARCLSLWPGAELRPAAWPARAARPQCGSGTRAAAAPGRYRFAVHGCSAAAAASTRASEPFELP